MTVENLISELEQYDGKANVQIAIQPHYPLACALECISEKDGVVYLCQGHDIDYASKDLWP